MVDRLLEKYGSYTRVPLKSTEVAPGVPRILVEAQVIRGQKFIDKIIPYVGKDSNYYYSLEALQSANNLWRDINSPKKRRPLK